MPDTDTDTAPAADWLTMLRRARTDMPGLSHAAIARRADIASNTVKNTFAGYTKPTSDMLIRIVAAIMPADSPEATAIIAAHRRALGLPPGGTITRPTPAPTPAQQTAKQQHDEILAAIRTGLADIANALTDLAAAVREGHKT